ncbi:MAG: ATP-binding protein [Anaerolineae bacterium]|nr:ATP-binding protein [Anaerolineae bacterium]
MPPKAKNSTNQQGYDAKNIQSLTPREHVRLRPGMYVGGTDKRALHHLIYEVVDNSIDEALAGRCDHIEIILHDDGSVSVGDNGAGIPVDMHETGKSALEVVMTELMTGGKFDNDAYTNSGGLHGVGVSAVNMLSEEFISTVFRDGYVWRQVYNEGVRSTDVEKLRPMEDDEPTGTLQRFFPDFTVMDENEFSYSTLAHRFREMAFVTGGITLTLRDERVKPIPDEVTYYFDGGIASFVKYLNRNRKSLHDVIYAQKDVEFEDKKGNPYSVGVEIAFQYSNSATTTELPFTNTINTPDGGTHVTGLRSAITSILNRYARKIGALKEKETNFSGNDTLEGLTAIVSVKHPDPQFESQTKVKLLNPEVQGAVSQVVSEALLEFMELNTRDARRIIDKCMTSKRAREAAKKARDLVRGGPSLLESSTLPGKLADCSQHGENAEIYIVEGDSAGGCFSGDTKIALADGRNLTFEELVKEQEEGKEHFIYTIRNNGTVGLEQALHARVTKKNAQVIRLTLDNGETITCTPDHLFMLRDGSYKEAHGLTSNDSIMPLYRKLSDVTESGITIDGYEMTWDPRSDSWLFTHVLADWYNRWIGNYKESADDHRHHVDFNKLNNNPTNIQRMPADEHLKLHQEHLLHTLHRPDVIEKCREIHQTDEYRAMMSERMQRPETRAILSKQARKQWEDEAYKSYMVEKWRKFYESNSEYRQMNRERLNEAQIEYWSKEENRQFQAERVRQFFIDNPDARKTLSELAKEQWQDEELLEWRRKKTAEQWIPEFREKRRATLNQTYYNKTISTLKQIEIEQGELNINAYREFRIKSRDKSLLRFDTFCNRYFDSDQKLAREAVSNYNHRIVKVEYLIEAMDVYDIEVPNTHNFALTSGVFVHNSAKQGRDRHFQAILPLRGKILNTERARLDKILDNNEIKSLISALGTGIHDDFDVNKLRYDRVIIMTDADVDGSHIRTLLLTFFFRHMLPLIQEGHLYIAQPPIYLLKQGKNLQYIYPQAGLNDAEILVKSLKKYKNPDRVGVQRYKGLGEMNPDQLWETTMDPEHRTLLQVTIEDAGAADSVFDMLMGASVPPRKRFIQTNAKLVKNLDV